MEVENKVIEVERNLLHAQKCLEKLENDKKASKKDIQDIKEAIARFEKKFASLVETVEKIRPVAEMSEKVEKLEKDAAQDVRKLNSVIADQTNMKDDINILKGDMQILDNKVKTPWYKKLWKGLFG